MDSNKTTTNEVQSNLLANLKKVNEINNQLYVEFDDLVVCSAKENHVSEVSELWANHASIQQLNAPGRYAFKAEGKDWQSFVRRKIDKQNNLLLVIHKKGEKEIMGFLYLQTITLPSSELVLKGVIEDIYTKPQHRKQNIATKLLKIVVEWACDEHIKQVDFVSLPNIKGLSEFYFRFLKQFKLDLNLTLLTV